MFKSKPLLFDIALYAKLILYVLKYEIQLVNVVGIVEYVILIFS